MTQRQNGEKDTKAKKYSKNGAKDTQNGSGENKIKKSWGKTKKFVKNA